MPENHSFVKVLARAGVAVDALVPHEVGKLREGRGQPGSVLVTEGSVITAPEAVPPAAAGELAAPIRIHKNLLQERKHLGVVVLTPAVVLHQPDGEAIHIYDGGAAAVFAVDDVLIAVVKLATLMNEVPRLFHAGDDDLLPATGIAPQ